LPGDVHEERRVCPDSVVAMRQNGYFLTVNAPVEISGKIVLLREMSVNRTTTLLATLEAGTNVAPESAMICCYDTLEDNAAAIFLQS
jgi:hypothetical protein